MRVLLRNRRFLALCCAYGTYLLAYNQLYLALPDEVQRATGSQAALSWLFTLSLLVVCAQLPVTLPQCLKGLGGTPRRATGSTCAAPWRGGCC